MTTTEFSGTWFLPNRSQDAVYGTLRISDTGEASLNLSGTLDYVPPTKIKSPEVVLGTSDKGDAITLYRCHETNRSFSVKNANSGRSSRLTAQVVFVGMHFNQGKDILFSRVDAEYDYLAEWAGLTGFKLSHKLRKAKGLIPKIVTTARYQKPVLRPAVVDGVEMGISLQFAGSGDSHNSVELRQTTKWSIQPPSPLTLKIFLDDYLTPFKDFLTLAVGHPAHQVSLIGTYKTTQPSNIRTVQIYFESGSSSEPSKGISARDMLFTYSHVSRNFDRKLQKWFDSRKQITPVHNLYFSTRYLEGQYLETQLLSLAQALETYHRRRFAGRLLTEKRAGDLSRVVKQSLKPILKTPPKGVTPDKWKDAKQSLLSKLLWFNEVGLQARVKEVVNKRAASRLFVPSQDDFARAVARTRNYLTHFNPNEKAKAATGIELIRLVGRLRALLEVCLLNEIGLEAAKIEQLIKPHDRFTGIDKWELLHQ